MKKKKEDPVQEVKKALVDLKAVLEDLKKQVASMKKKEKKKDV